jgi:Ankyrin repeat
LHYFLYYPSIKIPSTIMVIGSGGGGCGGCGDHQCCYREQLAFNMYSKFCEPKLYRLASKGDWDLIPARCKAHPKEATFRHKYAPNDTALHRILRVLQADVCGLADESVQLGEEETTGAVGKLHAIQAILNAHPPAAAIQDAFGRTPLHLACMDITTSPSVKTGILELLMQGEHGKSACLLLDVEKRTPLHYLVARSINIIPPHALQLLLKTCPEAVLVQDVVKETPMDIVTRRSRDGEMIEHMDQVLEILEQCTTGVVAASCDGGGHKLAPKLAPSQRSTSGGGGSGGGGGQRLAPNLPTSQRSKTV